MASLKDLPVVTCRMCDRTGVQGDLGQSPGKCGPCAGRGWRYIAPIDLDPPPRLEK